MTIEEAKKSTPDEILAAVMPKIKELMVLFVYAQEFESAGYMRDMEKKYLKNKL